MSELKVVPYDEHTHYQEIASWWEGHGLKPIAKDLLPAVGFIVPAICAGFLYQTDSDVALIEGLVSSPGSDRLVRDEALDKVARRLCEYADDMGFTQVHALTQVPAVGMRSLRHGFKESGLYRLYEKEL